MNSKHESWAMTTFAVVTQAVLWVVALVLFAATLFLAFHGEYAGAFMALVCAVLTAAPPWYVPIGWVKERHGRR